MATPVTARCRNGHAYHTEVKADSKGLVNPPPCPTCGAHLHGYEIDFTAIEDRQRAERRSHRN